MESQRSRPIIPAIILILVGVWFLLQNLNAAKKYVFIMLSMRMTVMIILWVWSGVNHLRSGTS